MSRRLRTLARRGQFFQLPLPQAPPAWIPQPTASTSRKPKAPLAGRRGVFFSLPRGQRMPHPGEVRQRKRLPVLRRGTFFAVPLTIAAAASPTAVAQFIQQDSLRSRYVAARRGSFLYAPLGQRMPHPSVMRRHKRALLSFKRGQFFVAPYAAPQVAPWPSSILRGARRPMAPIRRSVVFPVRLIGAAPIVTTRGVMFGVTGTGSTISGTAGSGSTMSGVSGAGSTMIGV